MTTALALTGSQQAFALLGASWPAPAEQAGAGGHCWLCGGTSARGWQRDILPPTFTNHNQARAAQSTILCDACAYFAAGDAWRQYVAAQPSRGLKAGHAMGWRSYSHLFSAAGHQTPTRAQWRDLLLDPPEPPFVAVIALSAQKHLLFRAETARDRARFPLLLEEERVWLDRGAFAACLAAFEALLALGLSRDGVASGRYSGADLARAASAGVVRWRVLDDELLGWRRAEPTYVRLAAHVARKETA